jgi:hypothetical protein
MHAHLRCFGAEQLHPTERFRWLVRASAPPNSSEHLDAEVASLHAADTYQQWDKRWDRLKHTPSEFQHELVLTCMQDMEDALDERENTEHLRQNIKVWRELSLHMTEQHPQLKAC